MPARRSVRAPDALAEVCASKSLRHEHLGWSNLTTIYGSVLCRGRMLVLCCQSDGSRGLALAVESADTAASLDEVLGAHAHHVVAQDVELDEAREACLEFAQRWVASRLAGDEAEPCACDEIELG